MAITSSGVGRTESIGASIPATTTSVDTNPAMATIASQLERLSATVEKLESRLNLGDRHIGEIPAAIRLLPAPPFSTQIQTSPFLSPPTSWSTIPHTLGSTYTTAGPAIPFGGPYPSLPQTLGVMTTHNGFSTAMSLFSFPQYSISGDPNLLTAAAQPQRQNPNPRPSDLTGFGIPGPT